jgi:hypothetical protein
MEDNSGCRENRDRWTGLSVLVSALAIIATIWIANRGWQQAAVEDTKITQEKEKIDFVSNQIQHLYGPLYGYTVASTATWKKFHDKYGPEVPFSAVPTSVRNQQTILNREQIWIKWMTTVFMPLNDSMEKTILNNANLIDGNEMPQVFVDFLIHVETYKPVIAAWERHDRTLMTSTINYPHGLNQYVCETFIRLKAKQASMLGLPDVSPTPHCNDYGIAVTSTNQESQKRE